MKNKFKIGDRILVPQHHCLYDEILTVAEFGEDYLLACKNEGEVYYIYYFDMPEVFTEERWKMFQDLEAARSEVNRLENELGIDHS